MGGENIEEDGDHIETDPFGKPEGADGDQHHDGNGDHERAEEEEEDEDESAPVGDARNEPLDDQHGREPLPSSPPKEFHEPLHFRT